MEEAAGTGLDCEWLPRSPTLQGGRTAGQPRCTRVQEPANAFNQEPELRVEYQLHLPKSSTRTPG